MKKQRIVITGGGSGLGRALALDYARAGGRVAVLDRDADSAAAVAAEIEAAGGKALALACDVTDAAAVADAATAILRGWHGVDVLINNAGIAGSGTVVDTPEEDWRRILEVNLFGVVTVTRAFVPAMIRAGAGHVVNIASAAGFVSPPGVAAYNVSKAAVISLSETLRVELAPHGISVSVACPSFFKTNLLEDFSGSEESRLMALRLMEKSPLDADDVARLIRRGVQKNNFMILPHAEARAIFLMKRFAPELFFATVKKRAGGFLKAQVRKAAMETQAQPRDRGKPRSKATTRRKRA
ncbi:MAG: SDR family NAD(P)-dependent oxidoreductase [Gammaproteobacteria bacterium]